VRTGSGCSHKKKKVKTKHWNVLPLRRKKNPQAMKNYDLQHNIKKIQKNDDCFHMYAKS
jgi:hypothetical protein